MVLTASAGLKLARLDRSSVMERRRQKSMLAEHSHGRFNFKGGILVAHEGIHLSRSLVTTDDLLSLIGNTPLLRLTKVEELLGRERVEIYAK
ncbi:MAG: hypothetical protein ACK40X_05005, partial [Armatimonadota bacterium]